MKALNKSLAAALLAGGSIIAYVGGSTLIKDVQFARAEQKVESTREQLANVEELSTVFRNVGKVVEPSVVNINVRKTVKSSGGMSFDEDMLRKFFPDRDGDGQPDVPPGLNQRGEDFEQVGTGSGVIIETDGNTAYIVTNNHVAGGASEMAITLSDGRVIDNGKVIGTDMKTDLAVVRIEAEHLIPAKWGDSDTLEKGDWIMAFGSPFGYVGSMTHGIVSALNRQAGILGEQGYESFIQVDAPINPGNSGGPLVNVQGEVVGINTAIASRNGGFQGIGFAIPSNQAKFIYSALKEKGKVTRGWLGVSIMDVSRDPKMARSFGYDKKDGVLVQETFSNTPAAGKLQPGDIITEMSGKPVQNVQQLRNAIAATNPGTEMPLKVFRSGKSQDVTLKIGEQPEDLLTVRGGGIVPPNSSANDDNVEEALGMKLANPTDELAEKLGAAKQTQGALITGIDPKSAAAKAGLRPGDVITQVADRPVANAEKAREALAKVDTKQGVRLYVVSPAGAHFVFIEPSK